MKKIRFFLLALLVWFFGFYNLERLIADINMSSYVYPLVTAYSLLVLLTPLATRFSVALLSLAGLALYLPLNYFFGHQLSDLGVPLIITEMASIVITIFLSSKLGRRLEGLRTEILRLTVGSNSVAARPFHTAQAECYREIRRARHYNRPAAILSISPTKEAVDESINRFILEAQASIIRQYIVARTADLLRTALKETDVITMRNDHFLVLLPETTNEHLPIIIERLQKSAIATLGLPLKVGVSSFPDDAITFESLVDYAEHRMSDSTAEYPGPHPAGKTSAPKDQAAKELDKVDAAS
jgi:hypothetical protein